VKIGSLVEKLFLEVFFARSIPCCSPSLKFGASLNIRLLPPCQSESIGMLLVKIGRTVQKLINRGVFDKNCSLASLDWNLEKFRIFEFVPIVLLN
jgi:hypothetical protein